VDGGWYWAEVPFALTSFATGANGTLLAANSTYYLQVETLAATGHNVTDVRCVVAPRAERPAAGWAIVAPADGLDVTTPNDSDYQPYPGSPQQNVVKARFLACSVAPAPTPASAGNSPSSTSSSSTWPIVGAAVAVPVGLAVVVALGVVLAFAVRKHVGKPKPPVKRCASSIAAHFARMNSMLETGLVDEHLRA
jgi:hypothetical protein